MRRHYPIPVDEGVSYAELKGLFDPNILSKPATASRIMQQIQESEGIEPLYTIALLTQSEYPDFTQLAKQRISKYTRQVAFEPITPDTEIADYIFASGTLLIKSKQGFIPFTYRSTHMDEYDMNIASFEKCNTLQEQSVAKAAEQVHEHGKLSSVVIAKPTRAGIQVQNTILPLFAYAHLGCGF